VAAEALKVVLRKFWPEAPPTCANSGIVVVPSGATSTAERSAACVVSIERRTPRSAIVKGAPSSGIVSLAESVPPAPGIGRFVPPLKAAATVNGPATAPVGPTSERTWAGVKLETSISRSKVTSTAEAVLFRTRLSELAGAPGTCVCETCGPGMMIGSVSGSYGPCSGLPIGLTPLVGVGAA